MLEEDETAEDSLFAALLNSYVTPSGERTNVYTPQLQTIARSLIKKYNNDANQIQIDLVNLLFRSVGGSRATILPDETNFEEMDSEEWAAKITDLVDDMRYTSVDMVCICADPNGALHAASVEKGETPKTTSPSLQLAEYRRVYQEFWHVLAKTALEEGPQGLQAEIPRELIMRMTEIVTAGQPDIRAAAVIATFQMGQAVLDHTAHLGDKLQVAQRQLRASHKQKAKAENLRNQVNSIKRQRDELEELIKGLVVDSVFSLRYRDSNYHTRAYSLESLSKMTLTRPDLFLVDKVSFVPVKTAYL